MFGIGSSNSDRSFYEAFERHAARIVEAGNLITEIVRHPEYRHGLATLFKGGYDAIDVMKWRDIIDNSEAATDKCEDVANILEGIVLEYS